VKIDQKPLEPLKETNLTFNNDYLKDLEEENRMSNYLAQKSMQNI
jgi:hypothetical protein